jgi:NifU-like domain
VVPCTQALLSLSRWVLNSTTCLRCRAQVLDEIRPYLIGTGGGGLEHVGLDGPICKVRITGPAAKVRNTLPAAKQVSTPPRTLDHLPTQHAYVLNTSPCCRATSECGASDPAVLCCERADLLST